MDTNKIFTEKEHKDFLEKSSFESFMKKYATKSEGDGTFEVVISTEHEDRDGDVIIQAGIDKTNYKKQPVVLSHHDWFSDALGIVDETEIKSRDGVAFTIARGRFAGTEKGQNQRKLYDLGLSGISIGFGKIVRDVENPKRIVSCELLEISFVTIMSQQNASRFMLADTKTLDYAVKNLGLNMEVKTSDVVEQGDDPVAPVEPETEEVVETAEKVVEEEVTEDLAETDEDSETAENDELKKAIKDLEETVKTISEKLEGLKTATPTEVDSEETDTAVKFLKFKKNLQEVAGELGESLSKAKKTKI